MEKQMKKILLFFIMINIFLAFFTVCFAGTESNDINAIDENLYPGVKSKILDLKSKHPNWNIKVEYTDLDFNEVIVGEHQGHETSSTNIKNCVPSTSASYAGLWICEICGKKAYDTGSWYCASTEALKYMIDVRNSVNETDIFQFLQLSSNEDYTNNGTVKSTLMAMASSTNYFDEECINAIITAATTYHVDPYYIMAKIKVEQGSKTTTLISGQGYNGQYPGVYNFFNIGATGGNKDEVIRAGLAYAASQGWTSKTKAIIDGTRIIANSYISKEQDTLYYQKFNVVGSNMFNHQYEQNILGAQTGGTSLMKIYKEMDKNLSSGAYTFVIPLYKNMPTTACPRPNTSQTHSIENVVMGDVNKDNSVNIMDVVLLINHLKGISRLPDDVLASAKVTGNSEVTIMDVVLVINSLKGSAVLPSGGYELGSITNNTDIKLSANGTKLGSLNSGTAIKVITRGTQEINGQFWDLVVASNGKYGYISRNSWR